MGCAASRINKEERVRVCKERKRLMKQLLGFRGEFAEAQLAYLRSLRNTGVTLRQFTESESLEIEDTLSGTALPPSPPPPLPPSPPPPPTFSPDLRKFEDKQKVESAQEEIIEIDDDNAGTPPPPPVPTSSWNFWDPFDSSSPHCDNVDHVEEENWVETNTEFEEEDQEAEVTANNVANLVPEKQQTVESADDNSSTMSWHTKDTAMTVWRKKKPLAVIVKELDDYFLKASGGAKDLAVLMNVNIGDSSLYQKIKENKRTKHNSAKVFGSLAWSWSSKSLQFTRDEVEFSIPTEPCMPGAHRLTLEKLYAQEQRLYKYIKEEELTKIEHDRKSLLLQKLDDEDHDWMKAEKARSSVESLQSDIVSLQQAVSRTCSSMLKLIDEELHPQLIALTSGLIQMWRMMHNCHQVQHHISQQINHLTNQLGVDSSTEYHRRAAAQLKTEVTSWYISFCKLVKSQQDYVGSLCRWIRLTASLADYSEQSGSSSVLQTLSEEWKLSLERLPDKVAAEAIKGLLSVIQSIILQQEEELTLQKRLEKIEKRLQRELSSLSEMEIKFGGSIHLDDEHPALSPKHPLSVKRVKVDFLKKLLDDEKSKHLNSVQATRGMTLNSLQTSLPSLFRALMGFSSAYVHILEAIHSHALPESE